MRPGIAAFRAITMTVAATAATVMFFGCGEAERPPQPTTTWHRPWSDDGIEKPAWLSDPTQNGRLIGAWGSTLRDMQVSKATVRDRAVQSARNELARMVNTRVQSVLKDWLAEESTSSGGAFAQFTESTSRSIADQSIAGSYQRADWEHPKTGEYYVWVVADSNFARKLADDVASAARTAATGNPTLDAHLRAKAGSDDGFRELDRLLKQP